MITGNGNKYDSEEECQKACPKEFLQADICQLPKETGPCFDLVERYYFDFQMGTCQRFEFGGCEGIILLHLHKPSLTFWIKIRNGIHQETRTTS